MKTQFIVFLCIVSSLFSLNVQSQQIKVVLPAFPNAAYKLTAFFGAQNYNALAGNLDNKGEATLTLKKDMTDYTGMVSLKLNEGISIEFVVNGENFSLSSNAPTPDLSNIHFVNSPENTFLAEHHLKRQHLSNSQLFAARYLEFQNTLDTINGYATCSDAEIWHIRNYTAKHINLKNLYSSSLWQPMILSWVALETSRVKNDTIFVDDIRSMMTRAKPAALLDEFANNIIDVCEQYQWNDVRDETVSIIYESGALHHPTRRLKGLMKPLGIQLGEVAPDFAINDHTTLSDYYTGETLLFFYETGCPHCEAQMALLRKKYTDIAQKNIHFVSVASDFIPEMFEKTAASLPWKDKVCDPDHVQFIKYGVTKTPCYFYIGKNGKIISRSATLDRTHVLK